MAVFVMFITLQPLNAGDDFVWNAYSKVNKTEKVVLLGRSNPVFDLDTKLARLFVSDSDPDNWQPVIGSVCYVYSAYLDPESNASVSKTWILGSLRKAELSNKTMRPDLVCLLWMWRSDPVPKIKTSPVYEVRKPDGVKE